MFPLAQTSMPLTRRQKTKGRKSREMDMMSDFDLLDLMTGNDNLNPIERELTNTIEGSTNHYDIESNSHPRGNPSQENEFRDFTHENTVPRQNRSLETMETFTIEINLRLS